MMANYYVKEDLPGLPAGRVERFLVTRAGQLGKAVEPFDEKKHGPALRKQEQEDAERRQAAEKLLLLERTDPAAFHAREAARRAVLVKAAIAEHKARTEKRRQLDEQSER